MQNYSNAIEVQDVSKAYVFLRSRVEKLRYIANGLGLSRSLPVESKQALAEVSFSVEKGKAIGIIGKNGSGKSTLLQIVAGILKPTTGTVSIKGKVRTILELGGGFNPELTGIENVYFYSRAMGMTDAEIAGLEDEILAFADIGEAIHQPVKTYSDGMFLRLAMAVQLSHEPDVLIIDEIIAAGDLFFQQKCHARIKELMDNGCSMVLATHDMNMVEHYCERALLLSNGKVDYIGEAEKTIQGYYSQGPATGKADLKTNADVSLARSKPQSNLDDQMQAAEMEYIEQRKKIFSDFRYKITDNNGIPKKVFHISEKLHIYCNCQSLTEGVIPVGGITLYDNLGRAIHGRDTLQYVDPGQEKAAMQPVRIGDTIAIHHCLPLNIKPGEYSLSFGVAFMLPEKYLEFPKMDLDKRNSMILKVARSRIATKIAVLSVDQGLMFHGLVNLNGHGSIHYE